ncbi:hypothetical protein NSIN_10209 [Nitrosotalea sinensis]|uniref:Glycosyltransferase 2-like domain-containing protein n=1 Tax=Nitrosotalea sinensis TaxID=1499975 RepID=A0A2H1EFK8_9ARCH|nr:glycosyltransferase family 2 protein [Candidatus Nitrosotalea sinensis]SHO42877.1 hypothetical protein NSIN_10209 [Candidatus Nitrosotalea sinensis]
MPFSTPELFLQKIRRQFAKPRVSILVPAFNAREFICETLDSLNDQTFQDFQILISIDKSDDDTGTIVERWCKEHENIQTKIFYQAHLLGWVQNINFLLKQCTTKYFIMMPHDDLIHKTYLEKLFHHIKSNPSACVVFSDVQGFGKQNLLITQSSVKGDKAERAHEFLINHLAAVASRGLVNRKILSDFILLSENNYSNIAIDTIWNMQMSLMGEMIRIPEVLYYKRYQSNSVHEQWWKFGKEDAIKAWLEHCTDCLKLIFRAGFEQDEMISLIRATKSRLIQDARYICPNKELSTLSEKERTWLVDEFEKTILILSEAKIDQFHRILENV